VGILGYGPARLKLKAEYEKRLAAVESRREEVKVRTLETIKTLPEDKRAEALLKVLTFVLALAVTLALPSTAVAHPGYPAPSFTLALASLSTTEAPPSVFDEAEDARCGQLGKGTGCVCLQVARTDQLTAVSIVASGGAVKLWWAD
jgi:hypothetical protein